MKRIKVLVISLLMTNLLYGQTGEEIFHNKCKSCHIMKKGWKLTMEDRSTMLGPTAFGVTKNIRNIFSNEKQFVAFVSDYITNPKKIKSRCKDNVIEKFGLMPNIGIDMSTDEKNKVSKWMFDNL